MATLALAIRLKDRLTGRCQRLSMAASGPCGNHRYDVIRVLPGDHYFHGQAYRRNAIILVTDVPDKDVDTISARFVEGTEIRHDPDSKEDLSTYTDRPRIIQVPKELLKLASPTTDTKSIDDSYDPKARAENPLSIPWLKLKDAIWDKVKEEKPDLTTSASVVDCG